MAKFNEYPSKATPEDADTLMLYDAASKSNKLLSFSRIWNWIVGKLTNAVINNLQTNNKTVLGAINELNSKTFLIYEKNVHDLDNPPNAFILNSGVNPKGLPNLGGNGCCVIQHNPDGGAYTAQLAFSFGSDKIAIRRKKGSSWSDWAYFSAQ